MKSILLCFPDIFYFFLTNSLHEFLAFKCKYLNPQKFIWPWARKKAWKNHPTVQIHLQAPCSECTYQKTRQLTAKKTLMDTVKPTHTIYAAKIITIRRRLTISTTKQLVQSSPVPLQRLPHHNPFAVVWYFSYFISLKNLKTEKRFHIKI